MKKIIKLSLMVIINVCFFIIPVNAGIKCSDGWESSCLVPGPGCCSHHGGIASNSYSSGISNDSSSSMIFLILGVIAVIWFFDNIRKK